MKKYKTLLNKVSKKIDKWHEKNQRMVAIEDPAQLSHRKFSRDEDYIEIDHSPTNFESSSSDNEDDEETKTPKIN